MAAPRAARGGRARAPSLDVILDASARLFEAKGYQNVTMQDVAEHLGIAKVTLYAHAKSKAAILEGIFERVMREGQAALDRAADLPVASERLEEMLRGWTRMAIQIQSQYRVYFMHDRDLPRPAARYYERWSAEVVSQVREMVRDGQRHGVFRQDLDATVIAFSVIAMPNWTVWWFDPAGRLTPDQIAHQQWLLLSQGLWAAPSKSSTSEEQPGHE